MTSFESRRGESTSLTPDGIRLALSVTSVEQRSKSCFDIHKQYTAPNGNQVDVNHKGFGYDTDAKVTRPDGHSGSGHAHGRTEASTNAAIEQATRSADAESKAHNPNENEE